MRIISLNEAAPGMVVARTLYSPNGNVLLSAGIRLTPGYITRLGEMGVLAIYVHDDNLQDVVVEDVVSEKTRMEAVKITKNIMHSLKINPSFDISRVFKAVNDIIDELIRNRHMVINLIDIRAKSEYIFGHSVHVAVLSIMMGISMEYNQLRLKDLAAGAMLHDIGKSVIDEKIVNKSEALTNKEKAALKEHAMMGFEILRRIEGCSLLSAHVALQHHEAFDGNGYPRGLAGKEISEYARVVSVANVYDKMTTDRVGHRRLQPFQAIDLILANKGKLFDPELVDHLTNVVAVFPVGTEVMLNTGEKGVVIATFKGSPTRPVVRLTENPVGEKLNTKKEINLQEKPEYSILNVVE